MRAICPLWHFSKTGGKCGSRTHAAHRCACTAFKTGAIDHSANFPNLVLKVEVESTTAAFLTPSVYQLRHLSKFVWCPEPESNQHARGRRVLSPVRLPISPSRQCTGATPWYQATPHGFSNRCFHLVSLGCNFWRSVGGSNPWLPPRQGGTLATELTEQKMVEVTGIEPATFCLQSRCSPN